MRSILCFSITLGLCQVNGFINNDHRWITQQQQQQSLPSTPSRRTAILTRNYATPGKKNAEELFESAGWDVIESELDELPVFTCANSKGQPLQYNVNGIVLPFFYCDVNAAKVELNKAKDETEGQMKDTIDLIPYPLGKAFKLAALDKAVIIPSEDAIAKAGAPPGTNPLGQQVPLFACMDIMQTKNDGKTPALPLFMSYDEAKDAMEEAIKYDGGDSNVKDFEIVCVSLERAVELLATMPSEGNSQETRPSFQFLAPQSSFDHIKNYLS